MATLVSNTNVDLPFEMDYWMRCWHDRDYQKNPTFLMAHYFWTAAKLSLCKKYKDDSHVLSFLDNMTVLELSHNDATNTRTVTHVSPFSGSTTHTQPPAYTVCILMKYRRLLVPCSPLHDRMPSSYDFVTLEHDHERKINNIYVSDYDGDGYNMWEFYEEFEDPDSLSHQERQYRMFMETLMKDEEKITHDQMSDIFQVLFDYFPVQVDF